MASQNSPDLKRRALGRGLDALLPSRPAHPVAKPEPLADPAAEALGRPLEIRLELIDRNPFQTRTQFDEVKLTELSNSIRVSGVVQPIVVRQGDRFAENGRYVLIAGERRLLASRKAEQATIPAIVREVSDAQAMELTIIENLQRADLNPMEQAHAFHRLGHEFKMTQEQIAERTGKDRASVSNFLRLLKLPESTQRYVESGELSFGHARALLALPSQDAIENAAQKVLALRLSVRATESYVQNLLNPEARPKNNAEEPTLDPNVRDAQTQLRHSLGLKVTIEDKKGKGRVIIEYGGVDDFDAILAALGK